MEPDYPERYKITVHECGPGNEVIETSYLTTALLCDSGAEALRGRGSQVFSAYLLESDKEVGELVAIKDVRVDDDKPREAPILAGILAEASDDDKDQIKMYFLTVISHGDVRVGGTVDHTRDLIMHKQDIGMKRSTHVLNQLAIVRFFSKAHYRIVFKELCTPVRTIKGLGVVFRKLCDGAAGTNKLLQFCDITNLAVTQASHFYTSINMSIAMLVMAIYLRTTVRENGATWSTL